MALDKPLDEIDQADLRLLLTEQEREGTVLDYKRETYGKDDKSRVSLCADITAFANTRGGHIIIGMDETDGLPISCDGISIPRDEEMRRIAQTVRGNTAPKLSEAQFRIHPVPLENGNYCLVIRVQRSLLRPHAVVNGDWFAIYSRAGLANHRLDVPEIRNAFLLSERLAERVRSFRIERLSRILSGETPIEMEVGAKVVVHLIPASAFDPAISFDVSTITSELNMHSWWGMPRHYNFDGYLSAYNNPATSYVQIFHSGIIEAVNNSNSVLNRTDQFIPSVSLERELLDVLPHWLTVQKMLGVEPPIFLLVSFIGIEGYGFAANQGITRRALRLSDILIPPQVIDSYVVDPVSVLLPICNRLWNAAGFEKSLNFDKGKWTGH